MNQVTYATVTAIAIDKASGRITKLRRCRPSLFSVPMGSGIVSANENGDDGAAEFSECFRALAKKVGILATHRAELMEMYASSEASHKQLTKELDEKY
ncbi:Autophagy-related protein 11 [Artemisia annua]|uniref:Autophagy-related protein 11 n=1 Tax=Artemisia annua TaxID=35608 RepID=A0A2U1LI23_ARTAN|nr:Autophagy-related protein 11 [Artemisia annua]